MLVQHRFNGFSNIGTSFVQLIVMATQQTRNVEPMLTHVDPRLSTLAHDVLACLGVNPLDMPRTLYWASKGKRSQ